MGELREGEDVVFYYASLLTLRNSNLSAGLTSADTIASTRMSGLLSVPKKIAPSASTNNRP